MIKRLKHQNPDKEYPCNMGQKWTDEEDTLLLNSLSKDMDIDVIAQYHNRTVGGINSRRRLIALILNDNNSSVEEIILKTRLDKKQILETIKKSEQPKKQILNAIKKNEQSRVVKEQQNATFSLKSEVVKMKNDINEIKYTVNKLFIMMEALYEFEEV